LPYIDTDRLSLVALGLMSAGSLRQLEAELIGSREWGGKAAAWWQERLDTNEDRLPVDVVAMCRDIRMDSATEGFRRRAVPALLYRYFAQMKTVFTELARSLEDGERCVFVVGMNRTGSGVKQRVVSTPTLLAKIAEQEGFAVDEIIHLDTWPRYGLHHGNGVRGESAVLLTRNQ
jgi:site-specific DNA-methyltransferase (cytosine-N4-specific)